MIPNKSSGSEEHSIPEPPFDLKTLNMNECSFDKANQVELPENIDDEVPIVSKPVRFSSEIDKVDVTETISTKLVESTIENSSQKITNLSEGTTLKNFNFR